ncbi:MAG: alanine--tRNA ligase-related protein [Clostridia bacterium]
MRHFIRHLNKLQIDLNELPALINLNIENLKEMYSELEKNKETIKTVIIEEKDKFVKTLANGEREFLKEISKLENTKILGKMVFRLYDTYGFPPEVTKELALENGYEVDLKEFEELLKNIKKNQEQVQNKNSKVD